MELNYRIFFGMPLRSQLYSGIFLFHLYFKYLIVNGQWSIVNEANKL